MVIAPAVTFLSGAWTSNRDSLFDLMTDGTLQLYYNRSYPSRKIDPKDRVRIFRRDFGKAYGRRRYEQRNIVDLLLFEVRRNEQIPPSPAPRPVSSKGTRSNQRQADPA
jgi:hypothetical protein